MTLKLHLNQLDGLRGLAIILVILAHLQIRPIIDFAPDFLKQFLSLIMGNGTIGVALLFLISGFLIKSHYPEIESNIAFWQKRYTRIFPPFLAMTSVLMIARFNWRLDLIQTIVLSLIIFWLGHKLWLWLRLNPKRQEIGQYLFKFFLAIQITSLLGYLIFQFYSGVSQPLQPSWLYNFFTWVANSTLIQAFGNSFPQLSSIYWSLSTEILFYLCYPLIFLPLFKSVIQKNSGLLNLLGLLSCGLFFYGLGEVTQHLLQLRILQLNLGFYFVIGMAISQLHHSTSGQLIIQKLTTQPHKIWQISLILICFLSPLAKILFPNLADKATFFWALPLSLIFMLAITSGSFLSTWLESNWLRFIGKLSYALYLTHIFVFELITKTFAPETVGQTGLVLIGSLFVTFGLAYVLHIYLEQPYFTDKISAKASYKKVPDRTKVPINLIWLTCFYSCLVWAANKLPVPALAIQQKHFSKNLPKIIPLTTQPIQLKFAVNDDHFEAIVLRLQNQATFLPDQELAEKKLPATLKINVSQADEIITQSELPLYETKQLKFLKIQFPTQSNSNNKIYDLNISTNEDGATRNLVLNNQSWTLQTVFRPDLEFYLRNPVKIVTLFFDKIWLPLSEPKAVIELLLGMPLFFILARTLKSPNLSQELV